MRLSEIGYQVGLLSERNYRKFQAKKEAIESEIRRLNSNHYISDSLAKILSRPETTYANLPNRDDSLPAEVIAQVEIAVKYAGYVERQEVEIEKFKKLEDKKIPGAFDFSTVPGLRLEARQKLVKIRPATIGQAARISGVSPADVGILMVCLKRFGEAVNESAAEESCESCGLEEQP
jgi:tRNA uridine 5-carboxymethylaminomethyl modification enzyme